MNHGAQMHLHVLHARQQAFAVAGTALDVGADVAGGDAARDGYGATRVATQEAQQIAPHQDQRHGDDGGDNHAPEQELDRFFAKDPVHVVEVDAAADDPAPGCESHDIGDLGHRVLFARLGPVIIDEALAVLLHHRDELVEQVFAVGILEARHVLAFELGLGGMHQDLGRHVVDPEVLDVVVAHVADYGQRTGLRCFAGHLALACRLLVLGDDTVGHLDQVAHLFLAVFEQQAALGVEHAGEQHDQGDDRRKYGCEQPGVQRHVFMFLHLGLLRFAGPQLQTELSGPPNSAPPCICS